jgi:response regulator RpfG family c-di-GMP phosphodiesterase
MVSDILFAILVVEDDGNVASMPGLSLRRARFRSAGDEAQHILEQQPSDPTIQELQLPGGGGEALLDWLRQVSERTRSLPVWLVTSVPDAGEAIGLDGSPGSQSLARPLESWDLVAMLEDLLVAKDGPY